MQLRQSLEVRAVVGPSGPNSEVNDRAERVERRNRPKRQRERAFLAGSGPAQGPDRGAEVALSHVHGRDERHVRGDRGERRVPERAAQAVHLRREGWVEQQGDPEPAPAPALSSGP
jgi:hypothetical protein